MQEVDHELGKYDYCRFLRKNLAVCAHETAIIAIGLQVISATCGQTCSVVVMPSITVDHLTQDASTVQEKTTGRSEEKIFSTERPVALT
jgi:hypothetical protein